MRLFTIPRFLCLATITKAWSAPFLQAQEQIPLPQIPSSPPEEHTFTLRQVFHHGTSLHPDLYLRADVDTTATNSDSVLEDNSPPPPLHAFSTTILLERPANRSQPHLSTLLSAPHLSNDSWPLTLASAPDITSKSTILTLAIMSKNAYTPSPSDPSWLPLSNHTGNFSTSFPIGWSASGLRGHLFANADNSTIVLALKGTTFRVFDGEGTSAADKENDNLFCGCCCGQGGRWGYKQVCDCQTSAYTCDNGCVERELVGRSSYWRAAREVYGNATALYPEAEVWVVGHSLGGMTSTLLGLTVGVPAVAFEAPGDALAAARLGLPSPYSFPEQEKRGGEKKRKGTGIYHFGHTADPVFMGTCNGAFASCTLAGFAFEAQCHTGKVCTYDVMEDKKWRSQIGNHRIEVVIEDVIKAYDTVPPCFEGVECNDCFNWKWVRRNGTETTTTTSMASSTNVAPSPTRTHICETPGWFGCNDKTTTTTTTTETRTTSSTSTVTCTHYGWFGKCLDPTTTTSIESSASATASTIELSAGLIRPNIAQKTP